MRLTYRKFLCLAAVGLLTLACRRNDPPPSHNEDLGDASQPLLPTSPTWKEDRHILDGSAEFHPLREPKAEEDKPEDTAEAKGGAPDAKLESDLSEVVKDHNAALEDGDYAKLSDFYVEAQIEPVKNVVPTLAAISDKLRELAPAMPDKQADIERLAQLISPKTLLKLNVASVQAKGAEEAVAGLKSAPAVSFLPDAPPADQAPHEVTFRLSDYWYVESPVVAIISKASDKLTETAGGLDSLVADAKAGSAKADDISQRAPVLGQMLASLPPAGEASPEAPGAEEEPADQGAGEENPQAPDGGEGSDGGSANAPDPGSGDQEPEAPDQAGGGGDAGTPGNDNAQGNDNG